LPHLDLVAQRGQVILSQRYNKPPFQGNIHAVEGYFYARCTPDNRILIGGGRHLDFKTEKSSEFQTNSLLTAALKEFAENYLLSGDSFEVQYQWSGIMGFADSGHKDYLLGSDGNIHYAVRLSGMGVALSPYVSNELVSDL
jgi:glycine/D-amino acid oxidase-like deaminating enzyme